MTLTDVFIVGVLMGGVLLWYIAKRLRGLRVKKRNKRAKKGEEQAIHFLESQGYTIASTQVNKTIVTWINGKPHAHHVRADYLVRQRGKTYVAEIKTGQLAPRPSRADTRRQLLEYSLAYRPDGILLVDMEKKKIHEIVFDIADHGIGRRIVLLLVAASVLGFIGGFLLYKFWNGGSFL